MAPFQTTRLHMCNISLQVQDQLKFKFHNYKDKNRPKRPAKKQPEDAVSEDAAVTASKPDEESDKEEPQGQDQVGRIRTFPVARRYSFYFSRELFRRVFRSTGWLFFRLIYARPAALFSLGLGWGPPPFSSCSSHLHHA